MNRFLYLTDTHFGAGTAGYCMQPRHVELVEVLIWTLRDWLKDNPVDFILHGGDVVEDGTPEQIRIALALLEQLATPVYLCLGNHDLNRPRAAFDWPRLTAACPHVWLPDGQLSYTLTHDHFTLVVITHHWNHVEPPHFWDPALPTQTPLLDDEQRGLLKTTLAAADRPVILALHSPLNSIRREQTGLEQTLHAPDPDFRRYFEHLARRYPCLCLALAGHNHVHTIRARPTFTSATTAAFTEFPFDARLITVNAEGIRLDTLTFERLLKRPTRRDDSKAWVHDHPLHRSCTIPRP